MRKLALLSAIFTFSFAYSQESIESLKKQLEEQRKLIQELEKKIEALEKSLEKEKAQKEVKTPKEDTVTKPADRTFELKYKFGEKRQPYALFTQPSFLPNISLIIDSSFVSRNISDKSYEEREIDNFFHGHGHGHDHGHGLNTKKGFNFNYAELYFYAPVDPYFDLYATVPITEKGAELEEGYFVTRSLPFGFQVKGGKFRSSFGRFNQKHPHAWDFAKSPLIYEALFGEEGLVEKGVQITWLAPTKFYLLFGAEVLQGENERSFGYEGFEIGHVDVKNASVPNLYVGFVKTSYDIGNLSLLTGLSYAMGRHRVYHVDGQEKHGFAGRTRIFGLDLTARYNLDSYRYISFEGEYIFRNVKRTEYEYDGNILTSDYQKLNQSGFYTQLVYKFHKNWRTGVRYDLINKNEENGTKATPNLPAYYAMLEYQPTEFSYIRLQGGQSKAYYIDGVRRKVNEVVLQFNLAIGAHGAHPF